MSSISDNQFSPINTFTKTINLQNATQLPKSPVFKELRGKEGSTWDAKHMTNFLNKSNYSTESLPYNEPIASPMNHRRSSRYGDYFFRTTKNNKNVSKFGYTGINPLVCSGELKKNSLSKMEEVLEKKSPDKYLPSKSQIIRDRKFLYQGNSLKFRKTDPLTQQNLEMANSSPHEKERLVNLIRNRYPHGMKGIDNPENPQSKYYHNQKSSIRIRREMQNDKRYIMDANWKQKGRVSNAYKDIYGFPKGKWILQRKFNNDDTHGFNIITNRQTGNQ